MNQAAQKNITNALRSTSLLTSKYKSSFVDYGLDANTHVIWNGYQDPETGTVLDRES